MACYHPRVSGWRYDVVVIGSGAGAAALLKPLLSSNASICVLERGGDLAPADRPLESEAGRGLLASASPPFAAEPSALGGGTVVYTGNVLRFAPEDFRLRSRLGDIVGAQVADWPLSYDELAPYYDQIEREMGVGGDASQNPFEPPRSGPFPMPAVTLDRAGELATVAAQKLGWHPFPIPTVATAVDGRHPCTRCGLCTAYQCTQGARWSARAQLLAAIAERRMTVHTEVTAVRITTDDAGRRAEAVEYVAADGTRCFVHGRAIVVAANAIQTPRILLASATDKHPRGLANGSDQVGRNLMTHVMEAFLTIGYVPGADTTRAAGCTVAIQDFYAQSRSGVALPITLEPRAIGAFTAFSRMVRQAPSWAALSDDELRARHRDHIVVLSMIEDLARADNRVLLDRIDYAPHALDVQAAAAGAARAKELLVAAGALEIVSVPARAARFHTMGTCRMGDDPESTVIDRNGRSHEVQNLYVADASCFVSSAGVNPSLTVQAVARRIGEHVRDDLAV